MAGWNPTAPRPEALPKPGAQGNPGGSPAGTPSGPSAAGAKGWAAKNRTTLLAAGAGGVVLLALVMKSRGASTAADGAAAGTMTTTPQNLAGYDSSSSDVYNAIQPQLEALRDMYEAWSAGKDESSTVPTPEVPTTTVPTSAVPVPITVTDNAYVTGSGATGSMSNDYVSSGGWSALGNSAGTVSTVGSQTVRTGEGGNVYVSANGTETIIPGSQSVETLLKDMKNATTPAATAAYLQALRNKGYPA